ncbi:MAG: hypothetical protein IT228_06270 [Flavobacteriales bacterium]|nr:hypothetical protein [Flavobacteriales bacterium]MCC6576930.1 hypothetical protein [Flavobacteriales bacterium]NUQ15815.1 hypothetical protein [Flavobacteriales bacterium]
MRSSRPQLILTLAGSVLLAACGGGGQGEGTDTTAKDSLAAEPTDGGGVVNVGGKLFSIPSPVQTALLIRSTGAPYQRDLLLDKGKADALTGRVGRALAVGLYGSDLAYATIHKDGQTAMATLQTIEKLSSALEMGNAFDQQLLDRFKRNMNVQDSLLRLSGEAFRAADRYLKNNDRNDISALVLTGGWIGSLHLALAHATGDAQAKLGPRIAEQRKALGDLLALLEANDKEKQCTALCADLRTLQQAFAGIKSTYTFEKPVTDAAARTTFIHSTSAVTITPQDLSAIAEQVAALRTKYLI